MIRYLKEEEKIRSRTLWEQCFSEDSQDFVDFYYSKVIKKNKILVDEEQGEILAMLHQNPYRMAVKDRIWEIDYIVGVATDKEHRKKGHMRGLLEWLFRDLYQEEMPFCFLMPADRKIYEPFDFTFIFDKPRWIPDFSSEEMKEEFCSDSPEDFKAAGEFASRQLENQYEVYCVRDEDYYQMLYQEVKSDQGNLLFYFSQEDERRLEGIFGYYGTGSKPEELREVLSIAQCGQEERSKEPAIMARIIHLKRFIEVICLKEEAEESMLEIVLEVTDELIRENHGVFLWKLNKETSYLSPLEMHDGRIPEVKVRIEELAAWFFGYVIPEQVKELPVRVLKGVYLNEII